MHIIRQICLIRLFSHEVLYQSGNDVWTGYDFSKNQGYAESPVNF